MNEQDNSVMASALNKGKRCNAIVTEVRLLYFRWGGVRVCEGLSEEMTLPE